MVLGENGIAYADNLGGVTAFDINSGTTLWTYSHPLNIVAAVSGGGLIVNTNTNLGLVTLDSSGAPVTSLGFPAPSATSLFDSWIGILNGTVAVFSGPTANFASSEWAELFGDIQNQHAPAGSIPIYVHEIAGANIDPNVITSQVKSAIGYWESKTGLRFTWKDNKITAEPNCLGVSQCDAHSPEWLLDIVSSQPFDPAVSAAEKGAKLRVAYSRFHTPTGINIVYVNHIDEAWALDIPILGPTTRLTDVILSEIDRPSFMGSTDLVMSHEMAHAFGLFHNALPLNLMCTIPPGSTGNALVDFFAGLLGPLATNAICGAPIERRFLTSHQKYCAQVGARKYYDPQPPAQTGGAPVDSGLLTAAHPARCP